MFERFEARSAHLAGGQSWDQQHSVAVDQLDVERCPVLDQVDLVLLQFPPLLLPSAVAPLASRMCNVHRRPSFPRNVIVSQNPVQVGFRVVRPRGQLAVPPRGRDRSLERVAHRSSPPRWQRKSIWDKNRRAARVTCSSPFAGPIGSANGLQPPREDHLGPSEAAMRRFGP